MIPIEKCGLTKDIQIKLISIFNKCPKIEKVILYGSRAKGNFKPGSDIDITIVAPQLNLSNLFKIENEIDELYLPYKIDLSLFHNIDNQDLIDHISRFGIELR